MINGPDTETRAQRIALYLYYLISSVSFRTYGSWKRAGMPNPFLYGRNGRSETSRTDISNTFADQLDGAPSSQLVRPVAADPHDR